MDPQKVLVLLNIGGEIVQVLEADYKAVRDFLGTQATTEEDNAQLAKTDQLYAASIARETAIANQDSAPAPTPDVKS